MKRWMLHAGVFALGAVAAAFAWPQSAPPKKHGLAAVYEEIGVTPLVSAELSKLDAKVGPLCKSLAEKRRALFAELRRDAVDPKEVERITGELTEVRAQMQRDVNEHLLSVKAVLSAEQRTRLFDRLASSDRK